MGKIGFALLLTYAFGKLINGFLGDRSNIRRFIATGLLASAVIIILFGFTRTFAIFVVLWGLNGWFQSMGAAPSGASISQWFSNRERGTRYGLWSTAHSIGEGITFAVTAIIISSFGWQCGFWAAGAVSILVALILFRTLADRPQTYGLPPVADYRNDHTEETTGTPVSVSQAQWEVLKNPFVWILGISCTALYVARYGINSWGVLYLQEAKGYTLVAAGSLLFWAKMTETVGALSSGLVSDFFFKARRNVTTLLYGLIEILGLSILFVTPADAPLGHAIGICLFGFGLGGLLVFLGGLIAIDICSKKASGAAMGLVGMFSYLGAACQDWISGSLIEAGKVTINGVQLHNFDSAFYLWLGAAVFAVVLSCALWNVKPRA
jgi:OPA family sugar phosphate sensor protein UhpC-like MFS transporter